MTIINAYYHRCNVHYRIHWLKTQLQEQQLRNFFPTWMTTSNANSSPQTSFLRLYQSPPPNLQTKQNIWWKAKKAKSQDKISYLYAVMQTQMLTGHICSWVELWTRIRLILFVQQLQTAQLIDKNCRYPYYFIKQHRQPRT